MFGNDTASTSFRRHPRLTTLADIPPTYFSQLDLSPPLDPKAYSNGMSVLIPSGSPDPTGDRAAYCNARYFPRKNKINAIVNGQHKLWFRVNKFDADTRNMRFSYERFTDMKDDPVAGCSLSDMRAKLDHYAKYGQPKHLVGHEDTCPSDRFWGYMQAFNADFWTFLSLARPK